MPRLILSFDMNTRGPGSERARGAFRNKLGQLGWTNELVVDGIPERLPDTTLVSDRGDAEAVSDVAAAEAVAKRVEPAFRLEGYVIGGLRRVDSRGVDPLPE